VSPRRRVVGSARARAWLVAATVLALTMSYALGWMTYAYTHVSSSVRYTVLEPGRPAEISGVSVRLVELTLADGLNSYPGSPPVTPVAGAIWVVAELEVTTSRAHAVCTLNLIGPGRRVWPPEDLVEGRTLPAACSLAEIPVGRPTRIEAIFSVPERFTGQLVGVAVSSPESWHRAQVLRP
jgi:hypothetical protein